MQAITSIDTQLLLLINGFHTGFLDTLMVLVTNKFVWIPLYVALLYVVWRNYGWKGALSILIMVGAGMLLTDWANAHLLRPWIGRLRPSNPANPISHLVHIVNGKRGGGCGFPSAHSANIWLLTLLMIHFFHAQRITRSMVCVALLVCYSRVYLGYHYPGDILGGFLLAWIVAYLLKWIHLDFVGFKYVRAVRHDKVVSIVALVTVGAMLVVAALAAVGLHV